MQRQNLAVESASVGPQRAWTSNGIGPEERRTPDKVRFGAGAHVPVTDVGAGAPDGNAANRPSNGLVQAEARAREPAHRTSKFFTWGVTTPAVNSDATARAPSESIPQYAASRNNRTISPA